MDTKTTEILTKALRKRLDAPRGSDPWNGGERLPLRQHLNADHNGAGQTWWQFYAGCTTPYLHVLRTQAWDANIIDALDMIEWELHRRHAGVTEDQIREWLR
jgi:hypothetical protein